MKYSAINLEEKLAKFSDHWSPKIVAQMNDYHFKLVKFKGRSSSKCFRPTAHFHVMHELERRKTIPHIIVKLYPGRSEEQKKQLANEIVKDVVEITKCEEKVVSVAFEEIDKNDWPEKVYKPDIMEKKENLYIEPGYNPFK